jgi:hypothetical protein
MEVLIMSKLTPQQAATKQAERLKTSLDLIRQGVARVTVAPGVKAAQKQDKMLANLTAAVQDGTWAKNVAAVTLEEWKDAMLNKGVGRIATGIDAAHDKQVAFFTDLFAFQDALASKVHAMSDLTLEDNIARATAWMRGMAGYKKPSG